jgi:hydroxymethylpyrimidine pyrophosphatase-like HAD family hydrolase
VLVLGLRTSGSYLAPLYAAALKDRGYREIQWLTVRGAGRLRRNEARLLDDVVVDDGLVLLVDDPPRSGQQLAEVAGGVGRRGVALASTILVLQVVGGEDSLPAALRRYPAVVLAGEDWEIIRAASPARLRETLAPMLGTAPGLLDVEIVQRATPERGHLGMLLSVRLADPPIGRQASLLIYAEGAGLGYFGRRALAVADAVKDFVPGVIGFRDGLVFREWLPQERRLTASQVRTAPEMVAGEIARYVHARSERLPVERDTTLLLERGEPAWEVVAVMLGHAFGSARQFVRVLARAAAKRLLTARRPAVVDADTAPWQWFADEGGGTRLRKIGFHQQTFANTAAACCDPVSDLAGAAAAAEAEEIGTLAPLLRTEYERLSGETIGDERWFLYRLHHHYRAYQRSLREAARGEGRDAAFTRALSLERTMARIHRDYFEQLYLADVEPATDGPFCALDLDGVIETRWLGYSAIAPAGALALRVLHRHGYRIVLATGRSLDEARERCHAYRLVGAVAEYGSVVYDPATDGARGLLSEADVARLEAVRKALEEMPGVFVDPVYRHSIRAHTVGGEGRPLGLRADLIAEALAAAGVENRIHAVSGHGQTDFVAGSVDKGRGLAVLLSQLEAPPHVEFAVGDGASDLAMFELAKRALAPASATADVSGRAEIVSQPYQAGLLDAVARVLGHRLGACAACRPTGPPSPEARLLLAALGALDGGKRAKARAAVALALRAREPGRPRRRSPARLRIDARPADDRGAGD